MPDVIGVQFQKAGKLEYYAPKDLDSYIENFKCIKAGRLYI